MAESLVQMAKRIQVWQLAKLKPYAQNARTHDAAQIAKIAASILEFGFNNPILVDSKAGIVAGHGRLLAALSLKMKTGPVIVLDHLTDAQRRAYVIADNRLALDAGWDQDMLAAELAALEADGFDLSLTGFEDDELEDLLSGDGDGLDPPGDDDKPPGVVVALMTFGSNKVEITEDELSILQDRLQQYVDAYGRTGGFASWLMEGAAVV